MKMTPAIIAIAATITGWSVKHCHWDMPRLPPPGVAEPGVCDPRPEGYENWEFDHSVTGITIRVRHPDGEYLQTIPGYVDNGHVPIPHYSEDTMLLLDARADGVGGSSVWCCPLEWLSEALVPSAQSFTIFQAPAPGTAAAEPPAAVVDTIYHWETFDTPNGYDLVWNHEDGVHDPDYTTVLLEGTESFYQTTNGAQDIELDSALVDEYWVYFTRVNYGQSYISPWASGEIYYSNPMRIYQASPTQLGAHDGGVGDYVTISTGEQYYVLGHFVRDVGAGSSVDVWIRDTPSFIGAADASRTSTTTNEFHFGILQADDTGPALLDDIRVGNTRAAVLQGADLWEDFDDVFHGDGYQLTWDESNDANNAVYPTNTTYVTGTNSLYIHGSIVEGTNHYVYSDLGSGLGLTDYVYRVYFNIADGRTSDHNGYIMSINTLGGSPDNYDVYAYLSYVSGSWYLRAFAGSSSAYSSSVNTNTWHYWEFHYPSGETRLDGSEDTNLADESSVAQARYVFVGDDSDANDGLDYYVDAIAIKDTTGLTGDDRWIGPVAYDYTKDPYCVGAWAMNGADDAGETDLTTNGHDLVMSSTGVISTNDVPPNYLGLSRYRAASGTSYLKSADDVIDFAGYQSSFSVVAWVMFTNTTSDSGVVGIDTGGTGDQFYVRLENSSPHIRAIVYDNETGAITVNGADNSISADTWYHVALVCDAGTATLYLDGSVDGTPQTYETIQSISGVPVTVFRMSSFFLNGGGIDGLSMFSRALSAAEIKEIYRHGITGLRGAND